MTCIPSWNCISFPNMIWRFQSHPGQTALFQALAKVNSLNQCQNVSFFTRCLITLKSSTWDLHNQDTKQHVTHTSSFCHDWGNILILCVKKLTQSKIWFRKFLIITAGEVSRASGGKDFPFFCWWHGGKN